jgi:DNA (cytosine-5)-methyltransferase 1
MKFGSLFTGIGGFDLAFEQAGMTCAWQCEINAAARSVLAKHWPDVPCYEDVRNVTRDNTPTVDLICGGFPCQDLSVAGKRAGLAGDRSGLWFEFHRILTELRPQWIVIENVPGLLSSNGGADFAVILRGLVECGYGVSWRIFDAQYFGVAQRRRRVFIVGSFGDGRSAEVLFEREGLFGHPPTRGEARQGIAGGVAPSLAASGRGTERAGESRGQDPLVAAPRGEQPTPDDVEVSRLRPSVGDAVDRIGSGTARVDMPDVQERRDMDRVEPLSFDWQTAGSERTYIHDQPGATRSLSASKTLAVAFGGNNTSGEIDIATAVNAAPTRRYDFESETFVFEPRYARHGRGAPDTIAPPLKAQNGGTGKGDGAPVVVMAMHETGQGFRQEGDIAGTIRAEGENRPTRPSNVVAFTQNTRDEVRQIGGDGQIAGALAAETGMHQTNYVATFDPRNVTSKANRSKVDTNQPANTLHETGLSLIGSGVRRLTPTECERLQGFPDGHTAGQSDSARYRQLGNAVAVPVARRIGTRIMEVLS